MLRLFPLPRLDDNHLALMHVHTHMPTLTCTHTVGDHLGALWPALALGLICVLLGSNTLFLALYHSMLVMLNRTTYEHVRSSWVRKPNPCVPTPRPCLGMPTDRF
jgi:hypothetical protein